MANLTTEEALNQLRDGMYSGRDVIQYDYNTVLELYNSFKELAWHHKRTVAELTMCRGDRLHDYEDKQKQFAAYHSALRQYACDCETQCGEELKDEDYCGWKAKQLMGL
jgi:hypothetical protein